MYEDVGMAMAKTIETRCSYGSMQARQRGDDCMQLNIKYT